MKLRGLQKYLQQNLGMTARPSKVFAASRAPVSSNSPQFEENASSFGVCYGLCIQAIDRGVLSTNLLPGEILRERLIRAKKPWAMMTAATLLLGCGLGYVFNSLAWKTTKTDPLPRAFNNTTALVSKSAAWFRRSPTRKRNSTPMTKWASRSGIPERQLLWPVLMACDQRSTAASW